MNILKLKAKKIKPRTLKDCMNFDRRTIANLIEDKSVRAIRKVSDIIRG